MKTSLRVLLLATAAWVGAVSSARAQCPANTTAVQWPPVSPVWDFCAARPAVVHPEALDGEGITLIDVKYKGVLVLKRASIPILNVKYQNGCGPSYRDWWFQERIFQCAPVVSPGVCSGTTAPARTVCEQPGADFGTFTGLAIEDKGTHLKLTSQSEAGWYRYIAVWEFWPDGTLQPRMEATAVTHSCVQFTHNHHAYFRLDFDLAGPADDYVDDLTAPAGSQRAALERSYTDTSPLRRRWEVGSASTPYRVQVIRNAGDQAAGDPFPVVNDFPIADGWVLAYAANEISDQYVASSNAAGLNSFLTSQNVNGADLVLWVRGAGLHAGEANGIPTGCEMFGPTIKVNEAGISPSSFHTLPPCRVLDTRDATGPYGGPALASGIERNFVLAGQCGIPANAKAVAANLTVTQPTSLGHVQIGPVGGPLPPSSVMNFTAGQTRANNATLPLGVNGDVKVFGALLSGSVHFILDVTGYYQ
jgi:hypothetical protein